MKKRISAAAMAALLCALTFTACSGGNGSGGESSAESSASSESSVVASSAAEQPTEGSAASQAPENPQEPSQEPEPQSSAEAAPTAAEPDVRLADWSSVEWEPYACPYFTLTIPKGWKVEYDGDMNHIYYKVDCPTQKLLGISCRDRGYACKDLNYAQMQGINTYMPNGTVQDYFEMIYKDYCEYLNFLSSYVPEDLSVWQNARANNTVSDYRVLYAQFGQEGIDCEGLFSALIYAGKDVIQNGVNYGLWETDMISSEYAPKYQLSNWLPVLAQIKSSFKYTDEYIAAWADANSTSSTMSSGMEDSDDIVKTFEERDREDTILQEKRSDMLEEYERVYDNETGDIYRAYTGFLDDMGDQSRYTPVTDSQYADGYKGLIDKPE